MTVSHEPNFPEQYAPFIEDVDQTTSTLIAYLPAWSPNPDVHEFLSRLAGMDKASAISEARPATEYDEGSFDFDWGFGENPMQFECAIQDTGETEIETTFGQLTDEDQDALRSAEWGICLTTRFRENILADFHTQLQVLHMLAPEAIAFFDCASYRTCSGSALREMASARVPPPPDTLYTLHVVTDAGDNRTWFHSHGLLRCGCIELELLDVPEPAISTFEILFDVAAARFIERGTPAPGEVFEVGRDLNLYWLPWEHAIEQLPGSQLGRTEDRDDFHDHPSGVLLAGDPEADPLAGPPVNVTVLQETLDDEPILFHTHMETQRMALMAKERFPRFRAIHRRFAKSEEWSFHVKLGYQVDDCRDDEDDSEHLWFDVHGINRGELDATLLNEPFGISRMHIGDRARHPVDQLSDWSIESPHGLFDAASIGQLEELVQ